jgi:hypothetical protein
MSKAQQPIIELENVNQRYTLGTHTIDALNGINQWKIHAY